jgi:putative addiction module component (TIGR02574 family)
VATDAKLGLMSSAARKLLQDALVLPEHERLELASELIASVDGPQDADWDATWLAELDRRARAATARGEAAAEWTEVRSRILKRLGRT